MNWTQSKNYATVLAMVVLGLGSLSYGQVLPNTAQQITPLAPHDSEFVMLNPGLSDNPQYVAGQAATSVVSPDGKTLLVLTSGYNLVRNSSGSVIPADSTQFVFVYDISQYRPVQKQVIPITNTYYGIVFDPSCARDEWCVGGAGGKPHCAGAPCASRSPPQFRRRRSASKAAGRGNRDHDGWHQTGRNQLLQRLD